jgi:hypothetical protein
MIKLRSYRNDYKIIGQEPNQSFNIINSKFINPIIFLFYFKQKKEKIFYLLLMAKNLYMRFGEISRKHFNRIKFKYNDISNKI